MTTESAVSKTTLSLLLLITAPLAHAGKPLHGAPFDFLFGNHIDTHQETKLKLTKSGDPEQLSGRFYIIFTGETDPISGLPVARHPRGAAHSEECGVDDVDCIVGWQLRGLPAEAKFLFHHGVNGNDHPVWLLNRVDIPQPGSFTHYHWITQTSNDPRWPTVPGECNQQNASQLEAGGAANFICPGWLLQLKAARTFAFEHGGEKVPVRPGMDNATHLNLLTNYNSVPAITPTR